MSKLVQTRDIITDLKSELIEKIEDIKAGLEKEIESIKENEDGFFIQPIKCTILKRDGYWAAYIDGILLGVYRFRFTARRAIKKEVKRVRLNLQTHCKYKKVVKESFYL